MLGIGRHVVQKRTLSLNSWALVMLFVILESMGATCFRAGWALAVLSEILESMGAAYFRAGWALAVLSEILEPMDFRKLGT